MYRDPRIFLVIFLCSFSSLAYEIALTRIFSVSLWYHFAFMIISIAMLGIGASGTLLSLYPKLRSLSNIGIYSLLLGTGISLSYLLSNQIPFDPVRLSWSRIQLLYIGLYYVTLSMPFFFTGLIIATAFSCISEKSGMIYGADLLGAGIGSIGILYLMTITGPDKAVFILSSIVLITSFIISEKRLKAISLVLILLNLSALFFQPVFINLRMSPYKGLQVALRYPEAEHLKTYFSPFSRIDTFKSPAVRFAPGLSLRYLDKLPEQIGFSIDGSEINAIVRGGNSVSPTDPLRFIRFLPSSLPYEIGNLEDVLILDPKGGLQVIVAAYYSSKNLYKVESNPLLIEIIRDEFKDFSGNIYRDNTWSGLGRSWLKSGYKKFDIIDISLMGSAPSGSFGISEDYGSTVEAFTEYIGHLKPEGLLSINLFILPPPRIELRLINTIITAMEELGIKDMEKQVVAIRSWGSICILIKRSPFTLNEIEAIKEFSKDRRFDLIHYPGIKEEEANVYIRMPSNEYFTAFKNILNPETRTGFIHDYIFDISPVRDDSPFFHYYLKLKNIKEIYKIMGEKWQYFIEEGYILPVIFMQVMFLSLVLVLLPAFSRKKDEIASPRIKYGARNDRGRSFLPYFAFLGIGFMFVEISLIQKIILPLENPSYAVATVLTSILISSGIGSLLSHRVSGLRRPSVAIVISFLIIVYSILFPAVSDIISPYSIPVKIILVLFILMPLGLLMGIPFPAGLKILGEKNESLIPWAWAINGCFSVIAPILTIMSAMVIGFKMVLWIGALTYMMAFITLQSFLKRSE
ncbi:MAG: hypothetical protein QMC83_02545 [Thermodesulfovibrionales bacterium]|nr:hypothetical protein [Thermodesulfovibrionales bacterium]